MTDVSKAFTASTALTMGNLSTSETSLNLYEITSQNILAAAMT
jgi:hypothetical protein